MRDTLSIVGTAALRDVIRCTLDTHINLVAALSALRSPSTAMSFFGRGKAKAPKGAVDDESPPKQRSDTDTANRGEHIVGVYRTVAKAAIRASKELDSRNVGFVPAGKII
eukprot:SAG31_NODE_27924_length_418_cov_0.811912_1_plen_109_part_01